MTYKVTRDGGLPMDARVEADPTGITFHSRGGSVSKETVRNSDYGDALRLVLKRLAVSQIPFERAWVDSMDVKALPIDKRVVLKSTELGDGGSSVFKLLTRTMKSIGQSVGATGGNSTRRLRIQFSRARSLSEIETMLHLVHIAEDPDSAETLSATKLKKVTGGHLWNAIERLHDPNFKHKFGQSVDFDLVTETGSRFPPTAVFGVAASEALGIEVQPKQFKGGSASLCFSIMQRADAASRRHQATQTAATDQQAKDRILSLVLAIPELLTAMQKLRNHEQLSRITPTGIVHFPAPRQ